MADLTPEQAQLQADLFTAIDKGRNHLLKKAADALIASAGKEAINLQYKGETPLTFAAAKGEVSVFTALAEDYKASLNEPNARGDKPAHVAVLANKSVIVQRIAATEEGKKTMTAEDLAYLQTPAKTAAPSAPVAKKTLPDPVLAKPTELPLPPSTNEDKMHAIRMATILGSSSGVPLDVNVLAQVQTLARLTTPPARPAAAPIMQIKKALPVEPDFNERLAAAREALLPVTFSDRDNALGGPLAAAQVFLNEKLNRQNPLTGQYDATVRENIAALTGTKGTPKFDSATIAAMVEKGFDLAVYEKKAAEGQKSQQAAAAKSSIVQIAAVQSLLKDMKMDLGHGGPQNDGVDGLQGKRTTAGIKLFQEAYVYEAGSKKATGKLDEATIEKFKERGLEDRIKEISPQLDSYVKAMHQAHGELAALGVERTNAGTSNSTGNANAGRSDRVIR